MGLAWLPEIVCVVSWAIGASSAGSARTYDLRLGIAADCVIDRDIVAKARIDEAGSPTSIAAPAARWVPLEPSCLGDVDAAVGLAVRQVDDALTLHGIVLVLIGILCVCVGGLSLILLLKRKHK